MNTNFDALENDLRALNRRALPEEWRNEMLQRSKPTMRTPRWLVAGWSVAWVVITVMYFTTPADPDTQPRKVQAAPVLRFDERSALIDALLASN
jgi:hypothetical protein